MAANSEINKTQITHHNHPSTKNLIYRYNTHPRETHVQRVTQTSQGSAGGQWASARNTSPKGSSKSHKKIGVGRRRARKAQVAGR
jgi:hypothetical protein